MSKSVEFTEHTPIYQPPSPVNQNKHHVINIPSNSENEPPTCRICLDSQPIEDLISPCLCKGSAQYVHRDCLDNWRATDAAGLRFKQCDICKFNFIIDELTNDTEEQKYARLMKFRLYVVRDIILSIIGLCFIITFFTLMIASIDIQERHIVELFPTALQPHTYIIYTFCGFIVFLSLLGVVGSCIACTGQRNGHNHDLMPPWYCYCTDCSCIEACAASDGIGLLLGLLLIAVFAVVGAIVGVYFSIYAVKQITIKHTAKLWLQQETKRFIVQDLKGNPPPAANNEGHDDMDQLIV